jgi:hypothetical protein
MWCPLQISIFLLFGFNNPRLIFLRSFNTLYLISNISESPASPVIPSPGQPGVKWSYSVLESILVLKKGENTVW